ncbi:MAG TPA: DEAD/DEAH box helicase [Rhodanobacteraceae bacterium]
MQRTNHDECSKTATPSRESPRPESSLPEAWREILTGRPPAVPHEARGNLGFFLELVRTDATLAAALDVAPLLLTPKHRGQPVKAVPLDAQRLAHAHLSAAELHLAASVLGRPLSSRKGRHYTRLAGPGSDALLTDMLDTAPCYLGGIAGLHLARGKARRLAWHWTTQADGQQQLAPQLPRHLQLLRLAGLWYLDAERAELGPLGNDHDDAWLLDAPPLAPEHSADFAHALASSPLAGRIPPPRTFESVKPITPSPKPILTLLALTQIPGQTSSSTPLAYARLAFDYAGVLLPWRDNAPDVRHVQHGQLVEIQRQRAEELAVIERLEAIGLNPAVDTEGLPWAVAETFPDDAWLFPGTGHSGALDVNTASRWMAQRDRLERDGFTLAYDPSFPFEVAAGPARWYVQAHDTRGHRRFELEIGVDVGGTHVNLLPAVTQALHAGEWSLEPGEHEADEALWYAPLDARRRLPVRLAELRPLLAPVAEYLLRPAAHIQLPRVQAGRLDELAQSLPDPDSIKAPPVLREFTTRLREAAHHASDAVPATLQATLRPYQRDGLRWLNALANAGIGGVLADDMGLGKTLQVLAHLLALKDAGQLDHPALIVAPTSLIPNWQSETARFAPSLSLLALNGPQRAEHFEHIDAHAIVLTSYALLPRDLDTLKKHRFALIVLDEAQQVKNPRTRARRSVLRLKAPRHLCLTGTPLENHLGELWSQIDLAVPGLLGDESAFRHHYRIPIEKHHDEERQERLNQRLAPFILRRTKAQVATELPPKTEVARRVVLSGEQRLLYDELREDLAEQLREVIIERGIEHAGIIVLDALLKLRQVCCDPRLVKLEQARRVHESAKFELLMDILPSLLAEGRRVLLFSQFTEMLRLIAAELDRRHVAYVTLTGDTRDRAEPVRRFQDGEVPLFLLSLKAGGVGLNLTAADAVIHYDPWWNPAAEAQASDRAHRIGQDKPVFVYRLIAANTVEERIEAMKERKAALAEAVLSGGGSREKLQFDQADLDALLAPA